MSDTSQRVYSDSMIENKILEYLQLHDGDSSGILDAIPDDTVFCNFAEVRENILRWYPFKPGSSVLEVGAGMGALTPFLASACGSVVALEPSTTCAEIISLRCKAHKNVQVAAVSLDSYNDRKETFDYVILVGVLEYAGILSNNQDPWEKMICQARSFLKPGGKLLLATDNKFGLRYWCGAAEDHTDIPFDSLNDYSKNNGSTGQNAGDGIRTFSKDELEKLLHEAGFAQNKFFYVLPDYKFPVLVLTDESQDSDTLVGDVKYTYSGESLLVANESRLYPQIVRNGVLGFFANSYLIEASNVCNDSCGVITAVLKRDFKPKYRVTTVIDGEYVTRSASSAESAAHIRELVINMQTLHSKGIPCVSQEDCGNGKTRAPKIDAPRADSVFLRALQTNNLFCAKKMIDLLRSYILRSGDTIEQDGNIILKNGYPDMIFRNCFWKNNDLLFFDQEWKAENVPLKYIMYRSVRYDMATVDVSVQKKIYDYCGITMDNIGEFEAEEDRLQKSLMDKRCCGWFDRSMYQPQLELDSVVKGQMKCKDGHIELLLQSERSLQKENQQIKVSLNNLQSEYQILRVQEKKLTASLEEKEYVYRELEHELSCREGECQQLRNQIKELQASLVEKEEAYRKLEHELACREGECQQLRDKENRYLNELEAIKATRSWRLGQRIAQFARFFVPAGSKRAMIARLFVTMVKHPGRFFSCLTPKKLKKFFRLMRCGNMEQIQVLVQMNITGQPIPTALEVVVPEIAPVEVAAVREKNAADYSVLTVPQWENPTVSIVIPVYNQFEFTYHCVESILKNSGDITYEILIGNDCSTDLTTRIDSILPGVKCITNEKNLRFVLNCKNAAKYAKGKYLLFLNNDTQVQENWLEPLVTLIESADDIGMVGSKLIYPDGLLQEAGGILWRDGSAWNYGNRQNPSLPEFNYVKEVDYISGASIMLPRTLWEEIGGFDETFVPAYCDDSDLAFTVRKKGYRVLYQPKSVVVHFEGVSNGTDTASGQKQYQIVNSMKFYQKWKEELASHPENGQNVFQARDRSYGRKTLLMVDHYVPHFDKDAGSRTVFQYLKLFVELGFNVKFIGDSFFQHEPYTSVLQQMGIEVLYGPDYAAHWEDWIRDNGEHIDYVFLNRPHIAPKYMDTVRKYTHAKVIYYGHDLGFLREMREYEVTGDISFKESSLEWQPKELALMRKADMAYYPSCVEVDAIHAIDPEIRVKAIPAYLFDDVQWEGYDFDARKDIMFIGGFSHRPNVDAVKWLAKEILPELVKRLPEVKIHILGSNAPQEVLALANDHLIMVGFVTDEELERFYRSCRVSLVPLRYGAGIKGKVVEAMRFGTPVVTTSTGAEGIPNAEKAMLIEDDAAVLAERIAALYQDADALTAMSRNCISYIQENYSTKNAIKVISPEFDLQGKDTNS